MNKFTNINRRARTGLRVILFSSSALLMVSCGGAQQYQYLSDNVSGVIVQLPQDWTILEGDKILAVTAQRLPEIDNAVISRWIYGFSADPGARGESLLSATSGKPGGIVRSRYLLASEAYTPEALAVRNLLSQINDMALISGGSLTEKSRSSFGVITQSGVNGVGHTVELETAEGPLTVRYIVTVDPRVNQVNSFLIGCSSACFQQYSAQIDQVSRSFTVVDPATLSR